MEPTNEGQKIVTRLLKTMTPAEIAAQVGASSKSVANWRDGVIRPSLVFLRALRVLAMARGVR